VRADFGGLFHKQGRDSGRGRASGAGGSNLGKGRRFHRGSAENHVPHETQSHGGGAGDRGPGRCGRADLPNAGSGPGGDRQGGPRKDKPDKKSRGPRETVIEAKPPQISAEKLAEAFLANQADADERFANKWVEVTGTLVRVFRAPAGFASKKGVPDYVVELSLGDKKSGKMPLQFLFAAWDKKQLAGLKPLQAVTLQAYCRSLVPGIITSEGTRKGKSLHFWRSKVIAAKRKS
jgi:hypothetical protein